VFELTAMAPTIVKKEQNKNRYCQETSPIVKSTKTTVIFSGIRIRFITVDLTDSGITRDLLLPMAGKYSPQAVSNIKKQV
jgi:hypothetical protein